MPAARQDERKVYVVDTSVLVSAPDAIHNLTEGNTVVIPFPVLQELDRRRSFREQVHRYARLSRLIEQGQGPIESIAAEATQHAAIVIDEVKLLGLHCRESR